MKQIQEERLQSPCVKCKKLGQIKCRDKCAILNTFVSGLNNLSFGVADCTDEIGYRILNY